jgi:clan AA aspartic protease
MINGAVNAFREARVEITVIGLNGQQTLSAIIDTGFTGFLTLPEQAISKLGLTWAYREGAILGDGSVHNFDLYTGKVQWMGGATLVSVIASDTIPLIGMSLLACCKLEIEVIDGGRVRINPL